MFLMFKNISSDAYGKVAVIMGVKICSINYYWMKIVQIKYG